MFAGLSNELINGCANYESDALQNMYEVEGAAGEHIAERRSETVMEMHL